MSESRKRGRPRKEQPKADLSNKKDLLERLTLGATVDDLMLLYKITYRTLSNSIKRLKEEGYNIQELDDTYKLEKKIILPTENI